jgi:hypothetical protein
VLSAILESVAHDILQPGRDTSFNYYIGELLVLDANVQTLSFSRMMTMSGLGGA